MADFLQYKRLPLSRKAVNFDESSFEGFSAGLGNEDFGRDIIDPAAFNKTIGERVPARKVKLLDQHNTNTTKNLWGTVVDAEVRRAEDKNDNGLSHLLWSRFSVSKSDTDAQQALGKVSEGHLDGLSIGFKPIRVDFKIDDDWDDDDGMFAWLMGKGTRIIEELAWWETSLVIWGMNEEALTIQNSVKSILSFAHKITREGKQIDEEKVRALIHSLNNTLSNPEVLTGEQITDTVSKLDNMVNLLESKYSLNTTEELRDLYSRYKEENDNVNKETFMIWVSENISVKQTEEKDEQVAEETDEPSKIRGLEEMVRISIDGKGSQTDGEDGEGRVITFSYTSDDMKLFSELQDDSNGYWKLYPVTTVTATSFVPGWDVEFVSEPTEDSSKSSEDEDEVETALGDLEEIAHTLEDQVAKSGSNEETPLEDPDGDAVKSTDEDEGRSEHVTEDEDAPSPEDLEMALVKLKTLEL